MYDILGNLKKGLTQLVVLSLLKQSDGEMYGFEMIQKVAEKGSGVFFMNEGALYPTLHRMEKKGLVRSRKAQNGEKTLRRYYSLTDEGLTMLNSDIDKYKALNADMHEILGL